MSEPFEFHVNCPKCDHRIVITCKGDDSHSHSWNSAECVADKPVRLIDLPIGDWFRGWGGESLRRGPQSEYGAIAAYGVDGKDHGEGYHINDPVYRVPALPGVTMGDK